MTNYKIVEKIKQELADLELYNMQLSLPNNFMEKVDKIFELLEKIKNK